MLANSAPEQIKCYFLKVFEFKYSGEEYPVNLDDVWPLAYGRKEEAVRTLKRDFIESVDYQFLRKNAENPNRGRPVDSYYLSVECMEYFIAKKVKPVFEIYRKIFHKAIEGTLHFGNKHFITRAEYCEMYGKSINSFNGLLGNYPHEFLFARGVWSISTDLCRLVELKKGFESSKQKLREKTINQLSFDF